jgi:hypothetical protein
MVGREIILHDIGADNNHRSAGRRVGGEAANPTCVQQ